MKQQIAMPEPKIGDFGQHIPGSRKDTATHGHTNGTPAKTKVRKERKHRFSILQWRGPAGGIFLVKSGDKLRRPLVAFGSWEEGRAWPTTITYEGAVALWEEVRLRDFISDNECRGLTNMPRQGQDYRNGAAVLPDQFQRIINPRGCQFGNWMTNRDVALNETFDGLHDLAGFLNWPVERMTFNGTLAFAFGARGHGQAAAHYEPGHRVINLTKHGGPGCLAHEWAHALDHHICGNDSLSSDPRITELLAALPQPLMARSLAADATRSGRYFSLPHERFARAFESWVRSKVENDYLVNIRKLDQFKALGRFPYALPEELPEVAAAFDRLFAQL